MADDAIVARIAGHTVRIDGLRMREHTDKGGKVSGYSMAGTVAGRVVTGGVKQAMQDAEQSFVDWLSELLRMSDRM